MIHVIRSEWVKLRSVRSTLITLVLAGGLVVLVALLSINDLNGDDRITCEPEGSVASTTLVGDDGAPIDFGCGPGFVASVAAPPIHLTDVTVGVSLAAFVFGALGVQVIGQEYRFNTIRPSFTAVPDRPKVLLAKLIVIASATAAVAFLMTLVCWAMGQGLAHRWVTDGQDRRLLWAIPLFAALWTTAGLGVGAIVRQPIAGILVLLGEAFIVENIVGSVVDASPPWLPFANGVQMTTRITESQTELRPLFEGGVYFAAVCIALFVIGTLLADRRDA